MKGLFRDVILHNPHLFVYSYSDKGIIPFKHQFQTLYHAMLMRPVRLMIADEIGLGKTIQALLIAKYLDFRGEIEKALIVVPKVLREQWREEVKRILEEAPEVIENGSEIEWKLKRPRKYFIISIDLAKRYTEEILRQKWDLVIVDEVHNATLGTQRYEFLKELTKNKDLNVIFLSATPHRGNNRDYLARLRLLDPTIPEEISPMHERKIYMKSRGTLVLRRTKKVVNELEGEVFKKCHFGAVVVEVSREEREFFEELNRALFELIKDQADYSPLTLLAVIIRKRASSSYEAALKTLTRIVESAYISGQERARGVESYIEKIFRMGYEELEIEEFNEIDDAIHKIIDEYRGFLTEEQLERLRRVLELGKKIGSKDSKLEVISDIVAYHIRNGEKVIIFTEFRDTLEYVLERLPDILRRKHGIVLEKDDIAKLHGGMKSEEIEREINKFHERANLLVSTDVASEGLNLHVASVVINYEAPWSPIKLEQRVGRIWRLNQTRETKAYTIFLATETDLDVLNNLYRKIMNIKEAVGSGPIIGRPIFEGDFENLWNEGAEEENREVSEYELILASIKGELKGYAGALVRTLRILKQKVEGAVPVNPAGSIRRELEIILEDTPDVEVLKKIVNRNVPNPFRLVRGLLREAEGIEGIRVLVKGYDGSMDVYYAIFYDEDGREIYRYPILAENGKYLVGFNLLKRISEVLSKEYKVVRGASEEVDYKVKTLVMDNIYNLIVKKYLEYDSLNIKEGKIFKRLKVEIKKALEVKGISEEEFEVIKRVPPEIMEVLGLDSTKIELPTNEYLKIFERNFVPLDKILESEKKAMEIVMELEKSRGYNVEDVSLREHYDIRAFTDGEEKYIEVKGHYPMLLLAELTEKEFEFAQKNEDKYWIYIVSNIAKDPVIVKIYKPFSQDRRVFVVKNGEDVEVNINIEIKKKDRHLLKLS
ncbi:ATP-dependent helicase [Pyrococcus furiosus DSM 3638]|uniref:ATP-dependent RNA helicase hepa, putative n=3 Tax=Pyrococcus furiosus TaxID=2261 RepID=Q8U3A6_PYRFU|nr:MULTISPECIES: DEAD/DEAH box helicase [Pyrococcus]AAL80688.1 ATP-dependent RNA helicase hepa, putative [Pyrococcus furiosus DSM 3638]AFN03359.1 ATP-dependent RNA helicase hepa [Pyrococcus furiosus COM1]MDK2869418.1 hypothetical protein [Pyrococcus sp.]QEK78275.1 ATP-dependent helicase [Pyrococcus furiosus DSM 3638]